MGYPDEIEIINGKIFEKDTSKLVKVGPSDQCLNQKKVMIRKT